MSRSDFYRSLRQLLPPGAYSSEGYVDAEVRAAAEQEAALDAAAVDLVDRLAPPVIDGKLIVTEADLPDWERIYDLSPNGGYELRCARLLAAIRERQGIKPADIGDGLTDLLGYRPGIYERVLFRCDCPASLTDRDPLVDPEEEVYRGSITIDPARCTNPFTRVDVTKIVEDIQTSGVLFEVAFLGFYCDDANSLTDADLLAV